MKYCDVMLVLAVGLGFVGTSFAAGLTNEVIVGDVNTLNTAAATNEFVVVDTTGEDFYILNSSISSVDGTNKVFTSPIPVSPATQYAVGRGGVNLSWPEDHLVNVNTSTIIGGNGGSISAGFYSANNRTLNVNGAVGLRVHNGTLVFNDTSITGGAGGVIDTAQSNAGSSALGGAAILMSGSGSLSATNAAILGGMGGSALDRSRDGLTASGGEGIRVMGGTQIISLIDSIVTGGDGGTIYRKGSAHGVAGLLVTGGANVTVDNGTFVGGAAGNVNAAGVTSIAPLITPTHGASIEVQGATLTLVGGELVDDLRLSSGTSTVSLKSMFGGATVSQTAGTSTFNEWYDGQLSDVTVSGGTMNFTGQAFNLEGTFKLTSSTAAANFNAGLSIMDEGVLDLGLSMNSGASSISTEAGSRIFTTYNGVDPVGRIASLGTLTLSNGAEWIIRDTGTNEVSVGKTFDLATATGAITSNLALTNVHYVGVNSPDGYYVIITNIFVIGSTVRVTCGVRDEIDSDSDGLDDELEVYGYGTDPLVFDSDNDGLSDGFEINTSGTDPLDDDTDSDGEPDGTEYAMGFNPADPNSKLSFMGFPDGNTYGLSFMSITGRLFIIESRDSLNVDDWAEHTSFNGTGNLLQVMDASLTSNRFYRIKVESN